MYKPSPDRILMVLNEGQIVGNAKGRKVKSLGQYNDEVFWMSLEDAKKAISDKYEFLAERYERRPKKKPA
jgi:hypothetical protein